ncbi:hypothetical protein [Clostridium sp. BJN0013]
MSTRISKLSRKSFIVVLGLEYKCVKILVRVLCEMFSDEIDKSKILIEG